MTELKIRTENPKKKYFNKQRKISDFLIGTEKWQNGNLKKKNSTNRERLIDL